MNTPILFIVFNRPNPTRKVFSVIKSIRPKKLFIAADGPRKNAPADVNLCREVRNIVSSVDWKCEVKRLYRNRNYGCKKAVSSAIDWFFENANQGIILEDDTLPDKTFFRFSEEMLEKYKHNKNVMHIGGDNFQLKKDKIKTGYYFSKYPHIWGWASWRRAWKDYDVDMKDWPRVKRRKFLDNRFVNFWEKQYWYALFDAVYQGKIDTWDYQWLFAIWKNRGYSINPGANLVNNIGNNKNSTHPVLRNLKTNFEKLRFPLKLLKDGRRQEELDNNISKYHYRIGPLMAIYQKIRFY